MSVLINSSPEIPLYPLPPPNTDWIPSLSMGALDETEDWCYFIDSRNNGASSARIVRVNLITFAAEVWLDTGTMPLSCVSPCFSYDFSQLLFCIASDPHLYALNLSNFTIADLGDMAGNVDTPVSINRVPGTTNQYLVYHAGQKSFSRVTYDSSSFIVEDQSVYRSGGWSCMGDWSSNGDFYRSIANGGPNTQGPIARFPVGQGDSMYPVAGHHDNLPESNGIDKYRAIFSPSSLAVNGDGSTIYFSSGNILKAVDGDQVVNVNGGMGSSRVICYSKIHNRLVILNGFSAFVLY